MPLSEKDTWIKTQIQSSLHFFKVKYFASETVPQPEEHRLRCQDSDSAVALFHPVLTTDMQAQTPPAVLEATNLKNKVIMCDV